MRKLILLIFLTLLCGVVNAQEIDIVGKWKVKEIVSPKAVDNENIRSIVNGLSQSTFNIKDDNSISITSPNPTVGSSFFTTMVKDAKWNYKDNLITLVDNNTKGLIMKILVSIKDGKTIFSFEETNLILEVIKEG